MILNLVSGPRNVSTALMYSFAQRSDTVVTDEPFYGVYLSRSGVDHPGADAVLRALPADENVVRAQLTAAHTKAVLFVKNMAHHMEALDQPLIAGSRNIFLIRHPLRILLSYSEVMPDPTMRDIGIAYQHALFEQLRDKGDDPLVVDSGELLKDPPAVLSQLCRRCGLDYEQRMAHWPPGPKPYDGVWAPYWYVNVHRSTGFTAPSPAPSRTLSPHLNALYEDARRLYEKLRPFSLKA